MNNLFKQLTNNQLDMCGLLPDKRGVATGLESRYNVAITHRSQKYGQQCGWVGMLQQFTTNQTP